MEGFGVVLMAKTPRPGSVKTRLCPPFSLHEAAELASAALLDSVRAMRAAAASSRLIALDDGGHGRDLELEESWGVAVVPQRGATWESASTTLSRMHGQGILCRSW